jgi:hypothetical protein
MSCATSTPAEQQPQRPTRRACRACEVVLVQYPERDQNAHADQRSNSHIDHVKGDREDHRREYAKDDIGLQFAHGVAPAAYRIGGAYIRPPWVQSRLSPRSRLRAL